MSSRFVNGTKFAVSTQLAAAVAISALSNADPAVANTATPPADGSIVVVKSGWTALNETVARSAGQIAATSFQLEDVDTSNTGRFPPGEGIGTFEVASSFVSITQVRDVQTEGGDQNFFQYGYIEDESAMQRQKPTDKSAMSTLLILDYDPDLPWYATLVELDRLREPVVLRETLPSGEVILSYGYLSFNKVPTKVRNENMTVRATFSLLTDPVRYPAP